MLMGIKKTALAKLIIVKNIDGTINRMGTITHYVNVTLEIGEWKWNEQLYVTKLRKQRVILGIPWLKRENPDINWQTSTINWQDESHPSYHSDCLYCQTFNENEIKTMDTLMIQSIKKGTLEELWINAKMSHSQVIAHKSAQKEVLPIEELVPKQYHEWLNVFDEKASTQFPDPRPWDHAIDMKPNFEPKSFKAYSLTLEECDLQEKFIEENLAKGYIRPSKSPIASPFFFITKKEKGSLDQCRTTDT